MVEVLETGVPNELMVYVTVNEPKVTKRIYWYRKEAATYFDRKGSIIARHWILKPSTVRKLGLAHSVLKLSLE